MSEPAWATDAAGIAAWERAEDAWFEEREARVEAKLALSTSLLLYERRARELRRAEEEMARAARRADGARVDADRTWNLVESAIRLVARGR